MRRHLNEALEAPVWPAGVHLMPFTSSHANEAHALLKLAYAEGGGTVLSFAEWWLNLSQDGEYDPHLCVLVCDRGQAVIGFAQCWTSAFIKDVVVHPRYRKLGIGRAVLLHIFRVFQERGHSAIDLKVHTDNPSGAVRLYKSVGMVVSQP